MIRAWRVVKARHASTAFDGEGSRLYGSRWNSPGIRLVAVSETLSLAILEILVHLQSNDLLPSYVEYDVEFDETLVGQVERRSLPEGWRTSPPPSATQEIGDAWVRRGSSAVLEAPSALIPHEKNYLLNPLHPGFHAVKVSPQRPLDVDPRIFRRHEVRAD
jgi:RES domain-containing protein